MAQDLLQIALEHHRAGRLKKAQDAYQQLLAENPNHPEATHWLGVLAYQAGQVQQAVPLLARAAALSPADAAVWHNLGQAYLRAGRHDDAVRVLQQSATLAPNRPETLLALGQALLARKASGDVEAAIAAFRQAHAAGLDSAELHDHHAAALLAAGQIDQAIAAGRAALGKDPNCASAYFHLALGQRLGGEAKEVRKCLLKALELQPALAPAWHALGILDAEAGNLDLAIPLLRRAIKADPDYLPAYADLGRLLKATGDPREGSRALSHNQRMLRRQNSRAAGDNAPETQQDVEADDTLATAAAEVEERLTGLKAVTLHHALAGQIDLFPPARVPPAELSKLFDHYADTFDDHLCRRLQYHVPELLAEAVAAAVHRGGGERKLDVLDLGCGTGLCGVLFRPMAATLAGVDLSSAMIQKARGRGVYDRLEVGDLLETLRKANHSLDLLTAADVLIYLGDLNPVFEAATQALRPGGLLAFSVEAGGGDRYHLHKQTLRFTHAKAYLQHLAVIHGFVEESFAPIVARTEGDEPVPGYLVVLRAPGKNGER